MLIELADDFSLSESCLAINLPRTIGFAGKETSALAGPPLVFATGWNGSGNPGAKA
jgi:hypothetical protein